MAIVKAVGDWDKARRILFGAPERLKKAMDIALKQEAQALRREIVTGITKQAPGGSAMKPLAASTIATRQLAGFNGTKALMVRGDLRNSVGVVVRDREVFVGIQRSARSKDGRPLVNVAELMEYGGPPVVIPITPKMRRFLAMLAKKMGRMPGEGGSGKGVVVTQTPARPFLRPAFEVWRKGASDRFMRRVAWEMAFGVSAPPGVSGAPLAAGSGGGRSAAAARGKGGGAKGSQKAPPRAKSAKHVAAGKLGWERRRAAAAAKAGK